MLSTYIPIAIFVVVATGFGNRSGSRRQSLLSGATEVLEPPIPKSIRFAEAPAAGRSILGTSGSHRGADAYREVAASLTERKRSRL